MTGPVFRSTAAFTMRKRVSAPVVDRATFVLFTWSAWRFAVPVESVEGVLRDLPTDDASILYGNSSHPLLRLGDAFHISHDALAVATARTVMFIVEDSLIGAVVDHVHEVATIDATLVEPLREPPDGAWAPLADHGAWPAGARGRFSRGGHDVLVLDIARITRVMRASGLDQPTAHENAL